MRVVGSGGEKPMVPLLLIEALGREPSGAAWSDGEEEVAEASDGRGVAAGGATIEPAITREHETGGVELEQGGLAREGHEVPLVDGHRLLHASPRVRCL